ncbi:transcription repressor NadR [Planomicrobium sp. CPCC 101110]|uniref:transcription repressor NadR n=1 Tax=Planomicrobium sp. CPCC 101110 TaxID=2599619 RepID=UPI0011B395D7|nr:transcription repressor NadR [Planomicrobium sp. CPCC 101110]TWT26249.1 transcription repressor NadR [Planomicrobium sp. CPCC 101110]
MKKLYGEDRRQALLQKIKTSHDPVTGGELAAFANVSRQVIVSDMTLLKAKGEPIIATSQGYLYLSGRSTEEISRSIACLHTKEAAERELQVLVDAGVTVKDVTVEHPVYGELTAGIHVSSRQDVERFMQRVRDTGASYLLELTGGYHLHTITAPDAQALDRALDSMREHGFLLEETE